jgi:hypothetical protein
MRPPYLLAFRLVVALAALAGAANALSALRDYGPLVARTLEEAGREAASGGLRLPASALLWARMEVGIRHLLPLGECLLALVLVWRAAHRVEARLLALFLVCSGMRLDALPGLDAGAWGTRLRDVTAALAVPALVHFAAVFPRRLTPEALRRADRLRHDGILDRLLGALTAPLRWGWKGIARLVPGEVGRAARDGRLVAWGGDRMLDPRWLWGTTLVLLLVPDAIPVLVEGRVPGIGSTLSTALALLATVVGIAGWIALPALGLHYLRAGYALADEEGRRRVLWFIQGLNVAFCSLLLGSGALVLTTLLARNTEPQLIVSALTNAGIAAMPVFFAVAIFYHGAVEPSLVIQKTAVITIVAVALSVGFSFLEEILSSRAAARMGLSSELGDATAGVIAGLTFGPLKNRLMALADRWSGPPVAAPPQGSTTAGGAPLALAATAE